jgi:hypothetical protein
MLNPVTKVSQGRLVRFAGLGYLISLIIPTLTATLIFYKLTVPGNASATVSNIMSNELLFRFGIAGDLIIAINALFLSLVLYAILKTISQNLARLALSFRICEAALAGVATACGLLTLLLLNDKTYATVFNPSQLQALAVFFTQSRETVFSIIFAFLGVGMTAYCYLFYKSNYIPKSISALGIFGYALLFIYSFVVVLSPGVAEMTLTQTIFYAPSCVFELIIGLWLILKGIKKD